MLLHVSGPNGSGTVSFDIMRRRRQFQLKSLAVDVAQTGERLLYEGENKDVIYNGVIRLQ